MEKVELFFEKVSNYRIPINDRVDKILNPEYISEMIGSFFLVFTVCICVLQTNVVLAPLSIGTILVALVFATGNVSGAHFNPAVSLVIHLVHPGKMPLSKTLKFIAIQCFSGFVASMLCWWIMGKTFTLTPGENRTAFDVMCVETFFSTALCLVVLNVATTRQDANNQYFGLAIGFTVVSSAFAIGPVSGCAINPAVSFGLMIVNFLHTGSGLAYFIVYCGTPLIGSFIASVLYAQIRQAEDN